MIRIAHLHDGLLYLHLFFSPIAVLHHLQHCLFVHALRYSHVTVEHIEGVVVLCLHHAVTLPYESTAKRHRGTMRIECLLQTLVQFVASRLDAILAHGA